MCKASMYLRLIMKGYISIQTLLTSTALYTNNILTQQDKIDIMAALLQNNIYQQSDLETYVTNDWITTEERQAIIDAPTIEC